MSHIKFRADLLLSKVSAEVVRESDRKEYNAYEWNKKINMYLSFPKCQFYQNTKKPSDFYVVYQADGILWFTEVTYTSCLSATGFVYVHLEEDGSVGFSGTGDDRDSRIANVGANRPYMRNLSNQYGTIFTNDF